VQFVIFFNDRLYTALSKTLYVYAVADLSKPLATYPLPTIYTNSGLATDTNLYVASFKTLNVYDLSPSLTQPLKLVRQIKLKQTAFKMLSLVGENELLLGEAQGFLQVIDMITQSIIQTQTH